VCYGRVVSLIGVAAASAAVLGCGSSATTSTAPNSPLVRCSLSLSISNSTIPASGGSGTVNVGATRDCTWSVEVDGPWLSVKSKNGQGEGTVEFTAAANPDPVTRRGALILNAQRAELTQNAAPCVMTLAEASASFSPDGGSGRVEVRASSALCTWTASSDQPWITIRGGSDGKGSAPVLYDVAATTGPPRTGTLTIAGERFSVIQSAGCTFTISPATFAAPAEGGLGTINIATGPECPWTATSNVPWIAFSRASGDGPAAVAFTVQPTNGPARTGTAVVAGQTFTVTQSQGCTYQVQPAMHSVGAGGGSATVNVAAPPNCSWTAASDVSWITIQNISAQAGNGTVTFAVAAVSGPARSGTLTIAGQKVTVNQAQGCAFSINPTQESVPASGGSGRVTVTAPDGCGWTASSPVPWLRIDSGATGSGNGVVTYTASPTTGPARSGTLTIAGRPFTVNQGAGCTYTLAPEGADVPAAGATGTVAISAGGGCAWTATSNASWIAITSPPTGSGNGNVGYSVAVNGGGARSGTLTIAGRNFTINQASGCSITLSQETVSAAAAGSPARIDVSTSAPDCAWTAASTAQWIVVTAGAGGTGPGAVELSIAPNTGPARSGTVTIGGRTVTVNQESGCTFAINPTSAVVPAIGGTGTVSVTAGQGCTWTATSQASWIVIISGASGTGDGVVQGTVEQNITGAPRSGTVIIAGLTFTVNQQ
jgi:hypothetical protein